MAKMPASNNNSSQFCHGRRLGALKCFVGFQKVTSEPLEHCDFVEPQGRSCISPCQTKININCIQIKIVNFNPHRGRDIVFPTICALSKQNLSQIIHKCFGHVSITILKGMKIKGLTEGLPENIPILEEPCPIFILTKAIRIPRGPTTDVSIFSLGSCFRWILRFSMLKVSVDLPQLLWLYVLLLHTLMDFNPKPNSHLLTSSNFLSIH